MNIKLCKITEIWYKKDGIKMTGYDCHDATYKELKLALDLACNMLISVEPPDSRAVSNEFVAIASVQSNLVTDEVMKVIKDGLAKSTKV